MRITAEDYAAAEAEANDRLDRVDAQFGCRKLHDKGLDRLIADLKADHDATQIDGSRRVLLNASNRLANDDREPLARIGPSPEYAVKVYGDDEGPPFGALIGLGNGIKYVVWGSWIAGLGALAVAAWMNGGGQ